MNIGDLFKINYWWKSVMWIGALLFASGIVFDIKVVSPKHLIGLGIGFFFVGLSFFMARKYAHWYEQGGIASAEITKHNTISKIVLYFGLATSLFFLGLLLWSLV